MYQISEAFFGTVGPRLAVLGWSVFPQERDGKRTSGRVDGTGLKWKPYQNRLPSPDEVKKWAAQCPSHNVAIITGAASGYTFALDIDVADEALAWRIRELADEYLGATPLKRIGRAPRIVLVYRTDPEARLSRRAYRFTATDAHGAVIAGDDMIEILAAGSPFTAYGRHHKTQKYFWWPEYQPLLTGPAMAPVVTVDQVEEFLRAVEKFKPFQSSARTAGSNSPTGAAVDFFRCGNVHTPEVHKSEKWFVEDGVVVKGRDQFLLSWTYAFCAPPPCQ
jgi:hypothetical protein